MSLLKPNKHFSVWDYLLIALGLLGMFAYFASYNEQDPRSIIDTSMDRSAVTLRAAEVANNLGYSASNFRMQVTFETNRRLLDSLQYHNGRQQGIDYMHSDQAGNLYPYFWEVHFQRKASQRQQQEVTFGGNSENVETDANEFILRFSSAGAWIELINGSDLMPERRLNREALRNTFASDSTLEIWNTLSDSAWENALSFDLNQDYTDTTSSDSLPADPHHFNRDEVLRLSKFYTDQAGWDISRFEVNTIRMETVESMVVARVRYQTAEPVYGQQITLQTSLAPTGSLLGMEAGYNPQTTGGNGFPNFWELMQAGCILLFAIGTVIIFYFRIRARVIDTKSALVISILAGFIVPVQLFLNQVNETNLFEEGSSWIEVFGLLISMGMTGAIASVSFFMVSAIGDSITRQHWPEKLDCYDYIRQGMFFNKPVGEILVRSVVLTFILAGLWTLTLWFFPNLYFGISQPFLEYEVIWPPLYLLLDNLWYCMIVAFGAFLVMGSQAYAQTNYKWSAYLVMVLAIMIASPLPFATGPTLQQLGILAIFGGLLTYIYMQWDFMTALLTYLLFSCLLVSSSGWIVANSPDFYVFVMFMLFVVLLAATGVLFIARGKEGQALPNYVPEYVEELAQEERIKQELQIARDVQQSFLPARTPSIGQLDLAAICKPAYETGGDYYDFIQLDDHRVAVAIGDVSGKGIQAAFYMTFTKGILHTLCRETESPAEVLKKANRLFYENARRGTFISLIYGIVDLRERTFKFARAGHNPILHYSASSGKMNSLQPSGMGLGLTMKDAFDQSIQEKKLQLDSGDVLLLYTDGVVEALNSARQFYGTRRLQEILNNEVNKSAENVLSVLLGDVSKFVGQAKQHDDMTMMVIKMNSES